MAPFGHNLVIASAGTGKTSTIVGRIAHLLNSGIDPKEILLLTFTNKASNEMINRVAQSFGTKKADNIESGTFHAVALRYLKDSTKISLKQPKELKILFKSIYEKRVFVDRTSIKPYEANFLYDIYSLYQNSTVSLSFYEWLEQKNSDHIQYVDIYEDIFSEFDALKREYGYASYNDLLLMYRDDMANIKTPLYREVLCDEYQDTNPLQYSIIRAINPESLFCVGDYDQSIYAFNGADISIISSFLNDFSDAKIFTLKKNYRSSKHIIDLANSVIEKNERIYPKSLEVIKLGEYEKPKLIVFDELFEQYQDIAKMIKNSGTNLNEIAVIFRNNSSADGIEANLRELGIPSVKKGGVSFFDTKEISLLLDICSLIYNPKDMMAYIHTLSYGKNIGSSIAKDIYDGLRRVGNGNTINGLLSPNRDAKAYIRRRKNEQLGLFEDFFQLENASRFNEGLSNDFLSHPILEHPKLNRDSALFLNNFFTLCRISKGINNPTEMVENISRSRFFCDIMDMLANERAKQKDGSVDEARYREAKDRIERKIILLRDLSKHYPDLGRFLNAMIIGSSESSGGDGVNLLTIHASKGLEFKDIYIVDLMDGRFPNHKLISKGGSLEEERRLFYVAVTRAKENLYLSYAKKDAIKNIDYVPSIFLFEAGLIKKSDLI